MSRFKKFPAQQIPYAKKNDKWRKEHLDWADDHTSYDNNMVRSSIMNKRINYDLVNGRIHMDDMLAILNPTGLSNAFIPDTIQHYSVLNTKLNVLRGEEIGRRFDYRVICTNPNAVSEIEKHKQEEVFANLQQIIQSQSESEEDFKRKLQNLEKEFKYNWQDIREIRANALLNHYAKEYNLPSLFADGFMDAMVCGEEIYRCYIVSGEPMIEKINPCKLRMFRSGYSSNIEDADVLVYEDYWSLGKIFDTFYDTLTKKDIKYLEELPHTDSSDDDMWNRDDTEGFVRYGDIMNNPNGVIVDNYLLFTDAGKTDVYDSDGNIRVLQVFWKSKRQIKKVKSYNQDTGEVEYNFYNEEYIIDETKGEEEEIYWINEAWEGYKIGKEIYTQIRPCEIQFNTMSNPSRCHFGFVGSIYNVNEDRVFSLVDTLKPFAYLYDVIHARLNEAIEANFGQLFELDVASMPNEWTPEKWLYFAKKNHIAIKDSFKEGNIGAATGKLAGNFAANSRGLIGTNTGDYITQHVNLLQFIKDELSDACGITKQREGNVSNYETVGGIERSTLQSSYITEWLFDQHTDVKKRVLECFLEVAKIAIKGRSKKFQYILSDSSLATIDIDGDEFAENDYGLVVDMSPYSQNLTQKLEALAQAALQNNVVSFSTIMRIYTNSSLPETIRAIEEEETAVRQQQQQQAEQQQKLQEQQLQAQTQLEQAKLQLQDTLNQRDNETRIRVAQITAQGRIEAEREYGEAYINEEVEFARIEENARQFDAKLEHEKKLAERKEKAEETKKKDDTKLEQDKLALMRDELKQEKKQKEEELRLKAEEIDVKRIQANKKPQKS